MIANRFPKPANDVEAAAQAVALDTLRAELGEIAWMLDNSQEAQAITGLKRIETEARRYAEPYGYEALRVALWLFWEAYDRVFREMYSLQPA